MTDPDWNVVVKFTSFLVPRPLKSKNRPQKRVQREKLTLGHFGEVTGRVPTFHIPVLEIVDTVSTLFLRS